jgi:hypothetical protein
MDITHHVDALASDLGRAAETGSEDVRLAAGRLASALEPAVRLTLMAALSEAAAEITAALGSAQVEVRLRGRDLDFVVTGESTAAPDARDTAEETDDFDEGEALARVTLRIPEALKGRAEALAARRGQSLNTWLVAAARAAVSNGDDGRGRYGRHHRSGRKHVRGWAK